MKPPDLPAVFLCILMFMNDQTNLIRRAEIRDASRLAEILVFSKRVHYRSIFQDDLFSFGRLQVWSVIQDFLARPEILEEYFVYDDGIVKGLIHLKDDEIKELYVDPLFEGQRIGSALMVYALERIFHPRLWVLEGNEPAIGFYKKHGFVFTGDRVPIPESSRYQARMRHTAPAGNPLGKTIRAVIDRPLGSRHPDHPDLVYPVNYGYIPDVSGGDGEEQDVYVLGIDEPIHEFTGTVIAMILREDDVETKWVAAPANIAYTESEIMSKVRFQEQFFHSRIIMNRSVT